MRVPSWILLVALMAPLLAGCLADDPALDSTIEGPDAEVGRPPAPERPAVDETGPDAGSHGDPHGEPETTQSDVETEPGVGGWTATQTLTFANGVGGSEAAAVRFAIGAGAIDVRSEDSGSYGIELVLEAQAGTEEEARRALDSMEVAFSDEMRQDGLHVALKVETPPFEAGGVLPGIFQTGQRSARLTAVVPLHLAYDLDLDTGSGDIAAVGLAGPNLSGDAGSGEVRFDDVNFEHIRAAAGSGDVRIAGALAFTVQAGTGSGDITVEDAVAERLEASSGSGDHRVQGAFDHIEAGSGSGRQDYGLTARQSGSWRFDAGSGDVTVRLQRAEGQAFDVVADNGSGAIQVELEDGEPVGRQDDSHVHVRSGGYPDAAIQTAIGASTGSGDIRVTE